MSTAVADTSFLFALYGNDAHTAAAQHWTQQTRQPITVSTLGIYQFRNAVRFAVFRKAIGQADAASSLGALDADLKSGHLHTAACDLSGIVTEASRLSELHTSIGGHRSFDILHVATARCLRAARFLSFDANQRRLALAVRLAVGP